jgi:hypothetical protein
MVKNIFIGTLLGVLLLARLLGGVAFRPTISRHEHDGLVEYVDRRDFTTWKIWNVTQAGEFRRLQVWKPDQTFGGIFLGEGEWMPRPRVANQLETRPFYRNSYFVSSEEEARLGRELAEVVQAYHQESWFDRCWCTWPKP